MDNARASASPLRSSDQFNRLKQEAEDRSDKASVRITELQKQIGEVQGSISKIRGEADQLVTGKEDLKREKVRIRRCCKHLPMNYASHIV